MKALTLVQPWAALLACGAKRVETRSWATTFRGLVAIHAGQKEDGLASGRLGKLLHAYARERREPELLERVGRPGPGGRPAWRHELGWVDQGGGVLAVAELVDVRRITSDRVPFQGLDSEFERAAGHYAPGRFAWLFQHAQPLVASVPRSGALGLWTWREVEAETLELAPGWGDT